MGVLDKCCGNCKHFVDKEVGGYGICESPNMTFGTHRNNKACSIFDAKPNNGWTEITPDNVEELYESKERVCVAFVCNGEVSYMCGQFGITLSTMAKYGGYYYYVLPELKIE